ncbi:hypothetical protein P5673_005502 [Acropora cervicornis]|uniref:Uncharacterized protein n=1 Tax=Acropora cervicornis TaxID=6130 RepID=A0AAD9QYC2_ACRCE|nr:hypothetical protein P5673_005502 [Acropora cervicornis]
MVKSLPKLIQFVFDVSAYHKINLCPRFLAKEGVKTEEKEMKAEIEKNIRSTAFSVQNGDRKVDVLAWKNQWMIFKEIEIEYYCSLTLSR